MGTAKVLVAGSSVAASQLKDLFRQIEDGSITHRRLQLFLDHQNPWDDSTLPDLDWRAVYEKLDLLTDLEKFLAENVTEETAENAETWVLPVLKGVTPNKVITAMRELDVQFYLYTDDLNKGVPINDRNPDNGSYLVRFVRTIEADVDLANCSADQLAKNGVKGITLLERLLLELAYFLATGEHLDVKNVTLCSGSRYSDGDVPYVHWSAGHRKVRVSWYSPGNARPFLRARAIVSVPL